VKDLIYDEFQNAVQDVTIRHASLLDILTKLDQAMADSNRAVAKSITSCGCVSLNTKKPDIPKDITIEEMKALKHDHIEGALCQDCKDAIEEELGNTFFYIAALCNKLDLNIYDVMLKEYNNVTTLGKFSMY
jgi:type II restriction/modification system DNA methylase subunit YeeA